MNDDLEYVINYMYDLVNSEEEAEFDPDDILDCISRLEIVRQQIRRLTNNSSNEPNSKFPRLYGSKLDFVDGPNLVA